MRFDRVVDFVAKCRRMASKNGCVDCGRVLPQGLFLLGSPSLSRMTRLGAGVPALKKAMRERGWYCKTCMNRKKRITSGTTGSLRDQFDTQEAYYEWLMVNRPNRSVQERTDKETSPGPGPGDGLCTIN